jgi:hypothetical protein
VGEAAQLLGDLEADLARWLVELEKL